MSEIFPVPSLPILTVPGSGGGSQGPTGPTGPAGTGVTGPTGATGATGPSGTVASVTLTGQSASIGTTTLFTPGASTSYELTYFLKVTTAAGASGSVTLTFSWTDSTDSQVITVVVPTPANAVDSTGVVSGMIVLDAKGSNNITYATTYASTPAGMQYKLTLKLAAL